MRLARHQSVTLEQAVLRCERCPEVLAIVESLGDTAGVVYLWKPDDPDVPSRCHGKGVSEPQAMRAYQTDACDSYQQAVIDSYHWPGKPAILQEPVLAEDEDEQLPLPETAKET